MVEEEGMDVQEDRVQISLSSMVGIVGFHIKRVKGMHEGKHLYVLIDTRRTHNFMDAKIAENFGCMLKPTLSAKVLVADGSTFLVTDKVEGFRWQFKTASFKADMMAIPLANCDVVLGIQLLITLGPVL